jgi:membrane protein implicated in regulation of membrane protease activity
MNDRWAPWWVYVIAIAGANYLRQVVVPTGRTAVDVALFAGVAVVVAIVVTAAFRATRSR